VFPGDTGYMTNSETHTAPAFIGPCSGYSGAFYCQCDECCEGYAEEAAFEMAAEARNEAALFGPTQAMLDDFAREADHEAWCS
jgi:hypothetical protein